MLNILGMIILIIILFIIILLIVGIKISFNYNKQGSKLTGCFKILILKKITVYSRKFPSDEKDEKEEEKEEKESKQRDIKKILKLAKPCFKDFEIFLKSSFNVIKVEKIENHLIFGLDSFADTGKYIGIIWAVLANVNSMHKKLRLSAEPSFNGSQLDGKGVNEIEIFPFKLLIPTIKLISKKDVRKFIRGVWDER